MQPSIVQLSGIREKKSLEEKKEFKLFSAFIPPNLSSQQHHLMDISCMNIRITKEICSKKKKGECRVETVLFPFSFHQVSVFLAPWGASPSCLLAAAVKAIQAAFARLSTEPAAAQCGQATL
jgi:hypothetical protein